MKMSSRIFSRPNVYTNSCIYSTMPITSCRTLSVWTPRQCPPFYRMCRVIPVIFVLLIWSDMPFLYYLLLWPTRRAGPAIPTSRISKRFSRNTTWTRTTMPYHSCSPWMSSTVTPLFSSWTDPVSSPSSRISTLDRYLTRHSYRPSLNSYITCCTVDLGSMSIPNCRLCSWIPVLATLLMNRAWLRQPWWSRCSLSSSPRTTSSTTSIPFTLPRSGRRTSISWSRSS